MDRDGQDIIKVNKQILPLTKELVKLGIPSAIYSTPITRTMNNAPLADAKKDAYRLDWRAGVS